MLFFFLKYLLKFDIYVYDGNLYLFLDKDVINRYCKYGNVF